MNNSWIDEPKFGAIVCPLHPEAFQTHWMSFIRGTFKGSAVLLNNFEKAKHHNRGMQTHPFLAIKA